jgi:aminoglycoside phosphotransferase (APT) family kinase protein
MRVSRFPHDAALPGLIKALEPQTVSAALAETLPEYQSSVVRILRCDVTPLRFRPGRRCTVRLSVWLRDKESGAIYRRVLYGKIYHDLEKAERVYQQMLALSRSLPAKEGRSAFATASAFLPDVAMVLQEPMEGVPLDSLMSCNTGAIHPRALAGTLLAASALAAFHGSGLVDGKTRSISTELGRFKKRGGRVGRVNPELGSEIIKLADALSAWLDTLDRWGARSCLVHGDCKPAQFLIQDQQVALLDFDHIGMADPAVDVGTYLATLQQMQVKQTMKNRGRAARCTAWMPDLKRQFLEAYCSASGSPAGFPERAAWYEAVGLLRKAIRGFERSPFSPLPAALIAEAWKELETLPAPSQS